ncbi:Receptor-like protein kinase ANXUR2 [Morella rubra]|uniref:Receptor-like protein kinase ANXUR2 n=1 Tax=Morella rubra TaxID=262757 RepID=A0A6A1VG48_9ROSI|nr:Receptor-like protein kinase ANXUR2 [Morella rubra]
MCPKALNSKLVDDQKNLAHWARKCIDRGTIGEIIDPYLKGKISPECFKVYVEVAESCVRDAGIDRPTMNDVMEKLDFALELQNNADAAKEKTNPGGEHTYPEVLSFHVGGTTGAPMCATFQSRHVWEDDSGTGLTMTLRRPTEVSILILYASRRPHGHL